MITIAAVSEPLLRLPRFPLERAIHWRGPRSGNENNILIIDAAPTTGKPKMKRRTKRQTMPGLDKVAALSDAAVKEEEEDENENVSGSKRPPVSS